MVTKVFKILLLLFVVTANAFGSQFVKCVSEDFERVFVISPMLKKDLFAPGKHRDREARFALIRMKHQGKIQSQELNYYKVSESNDSLKIKAKGKFQKNFIASALFKKVLKRVPDFRISLDLNRETLDGSGQITLLEYDENADYKRAKYEVYCKSY